MNQILSWVLFVVSLLIIPPLFIGVIRKVKARMQNRIGPDRAGPRSPQDFRLSHSCLRPAAPATRSHR